MENNNANHVDFGTGAKTIKMYLFGVISCALLTLLSFWVVMSTDFPKWIVFTTIYASACVQFFVQLVCFLRVTTNTEQGKINVMSLVFTGVILISVIIGSLWIMSNLHYHMMN